MTTVHSGLGSPIPAGHVAAGEPIRGARSTYYPVTDASTRQRCIAVRPNSGADDDALRLFDTEIAQAMQFRSANLVRIQLAGRDQFGPYCVVDADHDTTLDRQLRDVAYRGNKLRELLTAVAEAVKEVHDRGAAHGGIHPFNVLLRNDGGLRLSGFGISEIGVAPRPTGSADPYLEVDERGELAMPSIRSDLRAFARLVYHVATGEQPHSIAPGLLPRPYIDIVNRCFSEDPGFRIRRFDEVLVMLALSPTGAQVPSGVHSRADSTPVSRIAADSSALFRNDPAGDDVLAFPWRPLGELYEIIGRPLEGGMGAVIKARDRSTGKFVAIKRVRREIGAGDELVRRFLREARSIARLTHPNILSLLFVGRDREGAYIVFEWADCGSLHERLMLHRKVTQLEVISIARKIGHALAYAHGKGVVHRDIKPQNVLLTEGLEPKLADFGLARTLDDVTLTTSEIGAGTPLYVAPEQMQDFRTADKRSDLYSFGKMLYHLATGERPTTMDFDRLPPVLRGPIEGCVKEEREERFSGFEEFLFRLEESVANGGRKKSEMGNTNPRWILGGIAAVAMVFVAYIVVNRNIGPESPAPVVQAASGNEVQITNQVSVPPAKLEEALPVPDPTPLPNRASTTELLARLEPLEKERNQQLAIAGDMEELATHLRACDEAELAKTFSDSMERMRVASEHLERGITEAREFAIRPDARSFSDALISAERLAAEWKREWEDEFRTIIGGYRLRVAMDERTLANNTQKKFALRRRAELIKLYLDDVSSIELDDTLRQHLFAELEKHMNRAFEGKVRQADCAAYGFCLGVLNRLKLSVPPTYWEDNVRASMERFDDLSALLHALDTPQPFDIDALSRALFDYLDYCDIDDSFHDVWKQKIDDVRRIKKECFDEMDRPPFEEQLRQRMKRRIEELAALVSGADPDVARWTNSIKEVEKLRPELLKILAKHDNAKSVSDYDFVRKVLNTFLTSGMQKTPADTLVGTVYYAYAISQLAVGKSRVEQEAWYKQQMDELNELVHRVEMDDDVRIENVSSMLWAKFQLFEVSCWNWAHYKTNAQMKFLSNEGAARADKIYQELKSSAYCNELDRDGRMFTEKMKETLDRLR